MYSKYNNGLIIAFIFTFLALALAACTVPTPTPDPCSADYLIMEINNANATPATSDIINLVAACIYELAVVDNNVDGFNGLPSIISPIVINGNGATIRRSSGSGKEAIRLFHVAPAGDLTLNNVTLFDGIAINPPDVTIPVLNAGGAIYNAGIVSINNSLITDNRAAKLGGGIFNAVTGTLTITNTSILNNSANLNNIPGEHGGGIHNSGTVTIISSTIANNIASETGGGIANSGSMSITNSTISGNSTTLLSGPAIINSGPLNISYTTIAYNSGPAFGGAIFTAPDTVTISNSIIANNINGDCSLPATSSVSGDNLDSDGTCPSFTITDDPQLDPLANNGGPTQTHAIQPSSPAKNAASGSCPAADQRGEPRPHGPACDLGAYEFTGGGPPPTAVGTSPPTSVATSTATLIPPTATTIPFLPTWTQTFTPIPPSATSPPSATPPPTATSTIEPTGRVFGYVWKDANNNRILNAGENWYAGVNVMLGTGACDDRAMGTRITTTDSNGSYSFTDVYPMTYCVFVDIYPSCSITWSVASTPMEYTIVITPGDNVQRLFGYAPYVC
ncbi:MAG: hypothetical protein FVQ83_02690 [Chloroflexi bacterium]|nr:hypothetical protein [Chloroflexota bacterium]